MMNVRRRNLRQYFVLAFLAFIFAAGAAQNSHALDPYPYITEIVANSDAGHDPCAEIKVKWTVTSPVPGMTHFSLYRRKLGATWVLLGTFTIDQNRQAGFTDRWEYTDNGLAGLYGPDQDGLTYEYSLYGHNDDWSVMAYKNVGGIAEIKSGATWLYDIVPGSPRASEDGTSPCYIIEDYNCENYGGTAGFAFYLSWTDYSKNNTGYRIEQSYDGVNFEPLPIDDPNVSSVNDVITDTTGTSGGTKQCWIHLFPPIWGGGYFYPSVLKIVATNDDPEADSSQDNYNPAIWNYELVSKLIDPYKTSSDYGTYLVFTPCEAPRDFATNVYLDWNAAVKQDPERVIGFYFHNERDETDPPEEINNNPRRMRGFEVYAKEGSDPSGPNPWSTSPVASDTCFAYEWLYTSKYGTDVNDNDLEGSDTDPDVESGGEVRAQWFTPPDGWYGAKEYSFLAWFKDPALCTSKYALTTGKTVNLATPYGLTLIDDSWQKLWIQNPSTGLCDLNLSFTDNSFSNTDFDVSYYYPDLGYGDTIRFPANPWSLEKWYKQGVHIISLIRGATVQIKFRAVRDGFAGEWSEEYEFPVPVTN